MFLLAANDTWSVLVDYAVRISPGLALFAVCLVLAPTTAFGVRIAVYLAMFILIRDAMTPAGLWAFDDLRVQFLDDWTLLTVLGVVSVGGVATIWWVERSMRPLLVWRRGSLTVGGAMGIGAGAAIGIGAVGVTGFSPLPLGHPASFTVGLIVLAYGGNLLEEVLFRGYLQGWFESFVPPVRAAVGSGVAFAACHAFLATTVTDAGWPVLAFTAVEGLACAFVRLRHGVWAASLTHGTAILLVATPLT